MPRPRKRTCCASHADKCFESGAHGLHRCERHVYSMPFARPAAAKTNRRKILRLAGWISRWVKAERFLDAGGTQTRRTDVHAFPARDWAQEPHAGKRFRAKCDVSPWRNVF